MRSHEIEHRIFRVHSTGVLRCDVLEIEPTGYHQTSSTLRVRESRDKEIGERDDLRDSSLVVLEGLREPQMGP